jgi:hypothetical protein
LPFLWREEDHHAGAGTVGGKTVVVQTSLVQEGLGHRFMNAATPFLERRRASVPDVPVIGVIWTRWRKRATATSVVVQTSLVQEGLGHRFMNEGFILRPIDGLVPLVGTTTLVAATPFLERRRASVPDVPVIGVIWTRWRSSRKV